MTHCSRYCHLIVKFDDIKEKWTSTAIATCSDAACQFAQAVQWNALKSSEVA